MMRAVVIGFPKSGTTTIQRALTRSGLKSAHWMHQDKPIGKLIYDGLLRHDDPFHYLKGLDALTQIDYVHPRANREGSLWPNFDLAVLFAIREKYPDCKLILNYRDPVATAGSMLRWKNLPARLEQADMPGMPRGYGSTEEDIVAWIRVIHRGLRAAFKDDPALVEIDITDPQAPVRLGEALGLEIAWWGNANVNPAQRGSTADDADAGGRERRRTKAADPSVAGEGRNRERRKRADRAAARGGAVDGKDRGARRRRAKDAPDGADAAGERKAARRRKKKREAPSTTTHGPTASSGRSGDAGIRSQ